MKLFKIIISLIVSVAVSTNGLFGCIICHLTIQLMVANAKCTLENILTKSAICAILLKRNSPVCCGKPVSNFTFRAKGKISVVFDIFSFRAILLTACGGELLECSACACL